LLRVGGSPSAKHIFLDGKNFANPVKKARRSGRPAKCGICVKISKSGYYEESGECSKKAVQIPLTNIDNIG